MTTYTVPLADNIELSARIEHTSQGYRSHSLFFNGDIEIVREFSSLSMHYIDYCHVEVLAHEVMRAFPDMVDVWDYLGVMGLECHCDTDTSYACTDCYLLANDSTHTHPVSSMDASDITYTDWVCTVGTPDADGECREGDDICTGCDGSGTESGTTVGGSCDLCEQRMEGYWEYHAFTA